jgi:hypothetical protein
MVQDKILYNHHHHKKKKPKLTRLPVIFITITLRAPQFPHNTFKKSSLPLLARYKVK